MPKLEKTVSTKRMFLERQPGVGEELLEKRSKVREMRERESLARKHSIAHIIADTKSGGRRVEGLNSSIVLQRHFGSKLGLGESAEPAGLAFPRLSSNLRKKRVSKRDGSR